jgi:hypothetical protein
MPMRAIAATACGADPADAELTELSRWIRPFFGEIL